MQEEDHLLPQWEGRGEAGRGWAGCLHVGRVITDASRSGSPNTPEPPAGPSGFIIMLANLKPFWSFSLRLILMHYEAASGLEGPEGMSMYEQEIKCCEGWLRKIMNKSSTIILTRHGGHQRRCKLGSKSHDSPMSHPHPAPVPYSPHPIQSTPQPPHLPAQPLPLPLPWSSGHQTDNDVIATSTYMRMKNELWLKTKVTFES